MFGTADGQFARVKFACLFNANEWQCIQTAFTQGQLQNLGVQAYGAISRLAINPHSSDLVWWQPYTTEKKSVSNDLPVGVAANFDTLGWTAREALKPHEKEILAFIDSGEVDAGIGRGRKLCRENNWGGSNPFAGRAGIQRLMQGGTIQIESLDDMISAECAVIYCPTADGYLDSQNGYRELNIALMEILLQAGANPRLRDNRGLTALHHALNNSWSSYDGRHEAMAKARLLIKHGVDINHPGDPTAFRVAGVPPLVWAAQENRPETVLWLVEQGASLDVCDQRGNTVLHALGVKREDNTYLLDDLILRGANKDALNYLNETPLYRAVLDGDIHKAYHLSRCGASLDVRALTASNHSWKNQKVPNKHLLHALVANNTPEKYSIAIASMIQRKYPDCWQWDAGNGKTIAEAVQDIDPEWLPHVQHSQLEKATKELAPRVGARARL